MPKFLLKTKCEKLLQCKSFTHFFNKKYQCIGLKSGKLLSELTYQLGPELHYFKPSNVDNSSFLVLKLQVRQKSARVYIYFLYAQCINKEIFLSKLI